MSQALSAPGVIRRFPATVRRYIPGNPAMLVVDWPQDSERIQRRNDVRVDVSLPVVLEPLQRSPGVPRQIETDTMDLSAGGMRVVIQDRIPDGLKVRVRLKLGTGQLVLDGVVVRVHPIDQGFDRPRFWAGIQFTSLHPRDQQEIGRAVFNIQREQLRKGVL